MPSSFAYQSIGYYVSLLAEARGHRPVPSVMTVQDLTGRAAVRLLPKSLEEIIHRSLASLQTDSFTLSVYFGHNLAKRHDRMSRELITKDDAGRLLEFDALFIRETTAVDHHTYRLARRAEREGMVVIDDPQSILRCTNKVFLAELMEKNKVATLKSMIVHRGNQHLVAQTLGLPCVLKRPDSAFSQGVVKASNANELNGHLRSFFETSELVIAQQYMPTDFDWRIGTMDRKPMFACKYKMARGHWQIAKHTESDAPQFGGFETLPIEMAPRKAVVLAQKAADLIGDGLYGVDVKESNGQYYIIEVNDNPNLDSGVEDKLLRDDLYSRIMDSFLRRIEKKKALS